MLAIVVYPCISTWQVYRHYLLHMYYISVTPTGPRRAGDDGERSGDARQSTSTHRCSAVLPHRRPRVAAAGDGAGALLLIPARHAIYRQLAAARRAAL